MCLGHIRFTERERFEYYSTKLKNIASFCEKVAVVDDDYEISIEASCHYIDYQKLMTNKVLDKLKTRFFLFQMQWN